MHQYVGIVTDLAIVAAATVLAALGILPVEAWIAVVGAIGGARAALRDKNNGNGGPPAALGGGAIAIVFGLMALLNRNHS